MRLVLDKLGPAIITPQPNKYYTFIYQAKTPRIQYDQHPFILCGSIFSWGFTGYNLHWEDSRRYTWNECSNLFEINESEVETMSKIPTALIKTN
jgi:hypothetical protein